MVYITARKPKSYGAKKGKKAGYKTKAIVRKEIKKEIIAMAPHKQLQGNFAPYGTQVSNTAVTFPLEYPIPWNSNSTQIAQYNRSSNKILISKIDINLEFLTLVAGSMTRVIIVYDRGCEGISNATFFSQMTQNHAGLFCHDSAIGTNAPYWVLNNETVGKGKRFRVLSDKTFAQNALVAATAQRHNYRYRKTFKTPLKVEFDDVAVNSNYIPENTEMGQVWLIAINDSVAGTLTFGGTFSIEYEDLQ